MKMNNLVRLHKKDPSIDIIDLEILLAFAARKTKEFIFTHPEYTLSWLQKIKLAYFLHLRKNGYSVAAITGNKEFYGLDFFVNKNVLIPRPETELMVEEAVREIHDCHAEFISASHGILKQVQDDIVLIDVGTGSGCIPISILKNLSESIQTFAIDISKSALRVAKKNGKKHGVDIQFLHGNLLEPLSQNLKFSLQNYSIIITANLPYLTEQQFQHECSIQREPKIALVAKSNGLALYEALLKQAASLISNNQYPIIMLLEIDPSQTQCIGELIKQHLPTANFKIKKDLAGLDRLAIIKIN